MIARRSFENGLNRSRWFRDWDPFPLVALLAAASIAGVVAFMTGSLLTEPVQMAEQGESRPARGQAGSKEGNFAGPSPRSQIE